MNERRAQRKIGGVYANALVVPLAVVIAISHALIIALILMINSSSANLSSIMQKSGMITQEATSLVSGSSVLSETASDFVLLPVTMTGEVNYAPLMTYTAELGEEHRGSQVVEKLRGYGVDGEALATIQVAADSANALLEAQLHAISLVRAVHPLPETEPLTAIPVVELTEEEQAMPDEAKLATAISLMMGSEYGQNKYLVSQNVNACVAQIQAASNQQAAQTGRRVSILRQLLWIVTLSIIAMLAAIFVVLYRQILSPLGRFVKVFPTDQPLDEKKGIHEVRMVASAYNDVLKRRNALDGILRSAAETDVLTNLQNRYRFEQYILENEDCGCPVAVMLFDINFLKQTNDTQGHLAGDELIRTAAQCISRCFSSPEKDNCFRFGGDEFAAVVKHCTPESINEMVERFRALEQEKGISVSIGYAYAEDIGATSFHELLDEADRQMYANKKAMHEEREQKERH